MIVIYSRILFPHHLSRIEPAFFIRLLSFPWLRSCCPDRWGHISLNCPLAWMCVCVYLCVSVIGSPVWTLPVAQGPLEICTSNPSKKIGLRKWKNNIKLFCVLAIKVPKTQFVTFVLWNTKINTNAYFLQVISKSNDFTVFYCFTLFLRLQMHVFFLCFIKILDIQFKSRDKNLVP